MDILSYADFIDYTDFTEKPDEKVRANVYIINFNFVNPPYIYIFARKWVYLFGPY